MIGGMRHNAERGVTLVEMLLVMMMTVVLATAITYAFSAGITIQRKHEASLAQLDTTSHMEEELTRLIQGARLSTTSTTLQYFQSETDSAGSNLGCGRITFTTIGDGVPMASIYSDDDFETQQNSRGPVGGVAEVSIGTTPVGDAGDKTGLFERLQQPSDSDPTQGGNEFLLDPNIDSIGFEFYDGNNWVDSWDTTTGSRRLPEAVQVSYTVKNDDSHTTRLFVVPIPASDVTSLNPYVSTSSGT